jgi:hypothetical protein
MRVLQSPAEKCEHSLSDLQWTESRPPPTVLPCLRELGDSERCALLRSLAALGAVFVGSSHPLVTALRRAEQDDDALAEACALLEALPSLPKRHLLVTFLVVNDAGKPR